MHCNTEWDEAAVSRRHFLKLAGITTLGANFASLGSEKLQGVSIVLDRSDAVAGLPSVQWATNELETALKARGIAVQLCTTPEQARAGNLCIAVSGAASALARPLLKGAETRIPAVPEALGLVPGRIAGKPVLLACGHDERGLVYAVLELADQVTYEAQPLVSLSNRNVLVEKPANAIRSLTRLFVSDVEDKGWYNDRAMWPEYLSMLATQRFNRFNLSLGIGYDFLRNVTDAYFLFSYPFLLAVPGYNVRVPELPDAERDQNLAMLKFISEQTVARGMQFQLGLWMHGYEWINSPKPNYTIAGLTPENHGAYCRDAVRLLLQTCPAISGVTFRVHGESGVNEGSYKFWQSVFEGVASCGRKVEIDMHSKGMDQTMIDSAVNTGLPIVISPKYWAEHLGMPYHQADIRAQEVPDPKKKTSTLMNLSEGSRSFMRYGYGDLLKEKRPYRVLHRIWPGTQRLLLWGDPLTQAAHARAFSFSGSAGAELMEPLSFKGRRGSGIAGGRCAYADATLEPRWDWQKYRYSLRLFGRLLYNPDAEPATWTRYLTNQFGAGAASAGQALANASRMLPIVLTAHGTSAGNNTYWPEVYTNQPIVDPTINGNLTHLYDTPSPKVFANVSPLDPQLFLSINDYTRELLKGEHGGKYTPIETAQWLEDYATEAEKHLALLKAKASNTKEPAFRRIAIDIAMQIALGRFFASKFRAGVLYAIFDQTGDRSALEQSLKAYRTARSVWADLANQAKGVYKSDITVGEQPFLRGHWLDRLPAIDQDLAAMTQKLEQAERSADTSAGRAQAAVQIAMGRPRRSVTDCRHPQPQPFQAGQAVPIELSPAKAIKSIRLYYRHVDQAERYEMVEMQAAGQQYRATIPAAYTNSPYPLQYYFELQESPETASLYPGFNATLTNQPYFLVRQA
ncbi:hypothetical protein EXU85_15440 [Spirosoma sp. KCTC 42546]|uniref:hypothetical protein n=1 Tax=Spirosoma sp. KCTC 42546 TaxID=2520506 RepID=UPI001159399A|nr:hypothetical protein [Spirosoma sp. KCTC 42546]QDK79927.1 hypothetical protein EXU85_15440 [Spirosoma sp. KCTC 42546]